MKLGTQLIKLRKNKKLTQRELGQDLGLSTSAISNYERGRHEPDYSIVLKIADYYDVSLDYLFGRTTILFPLDNLDDKLLRDFTVADLVNTAIVLNAKQRYDLVRYIDYLTTNHESPQKDN
ncbi:MAG TPA: helix-turn-helix transcriptional regulator [Lachnospiraceae bacterium]|nr:helix-turn-helix transcriptional regulator [Lachnospiraceae bacterium]